MQPLQHSRLQPQITMELSNPWTVNSTFRSTAWASGQFGKGNDPAQDWRRCWSQS